MLKSGPSTQILPGRQSEKQSENEINFNIITPPKQILPGRQSEKQSGSGIFE